MQRRMDDRIKAKPKRKASKRWTKHNLILDNAALGYVPVKEETMKTIYGFYEGEYPIYTDNEDELIELHYEIDGAQELNRLVSDLRAAELEIARLKKG